MLNKRIKRILDDIIDVAYVEDPEDKRQRYKNYVLEITPKELSRSGGMYTYNDRTVHVYNASSGINHLAKVCLHELSHHIDCMQNGTSGHQKPFYEAYTKLIYASMDMGILNTEDFKDEGYSDSRKVMKILAKYEPHPVNYEMKQPDVIQVYSAYLIKDSLKKLGYTWNKVEQTWEKEIENRDKDIADLQQLNVGTTKSLSPWYKITSPDMKIKAVVYYVLSGRTFEKIDAIKEHRFYWDTNRKAWVAKVTADRVEEFKDELLADNRLAGLKLSVLSRK